MENTQYFLNFELRLKSNMQHRFTADLSAGKKTDGPSPTSWCNFKLARKGCDSFGLNWFFDVIKMTVDKNDEGTSIFFSTCLELVYSWYGLNDCAAAESLVAILHEYLR